MIVTTVVEHHANLLPWSRLARCRYVECDAAGTFGVDAVAAVLEGWPRPRPIAVTGAVDLVDLDEVVWTDPPAREEAGSPNLLGAVALHAAIDELNGLGWDAIRGHDDDMARRLRQGLMGIDEVGLLGPSAQPGGLPVALFVVQGMSHALVAARFSAEHAIGVRHGCFCAHSYLLRLLGMSGASAGIATTSDDIDRFLHALAPIASGEASPVAYDQDDHSGDFWPRTDDAAWSSAGRRLGASCARG